MKGAGWEMLFGLDHPIRGYLLRAFNERES